MNAPDRNLPNKPLVEALLELRWQLDEIEPGIHKDPAYPLYIGRLHDRIESTYPYVEELPAASFPDEMSPHLVKYRFRTEPTGWPLVQVGPGIITLNFTKDYDWPKFLSSAEYLFPLLLDAYQIDGTSTTPPFLSILLRYINSINVDFEIEKPLDFLRNRLHTNIQLPDAIGRYADEGGDPIGLQMAVGFSLREPNGIGLVRVGSGERHGSPAIMWELQVQSLDKDVPKNPEQFREWLIEAHLMIEEWFFTLIEGDLEHRFREG